jgi:hypothetical protein
MLEADDCLSAGKVARHLDRILHGFGPAVDQQSPLGMISGSDPVEPLGQRHIGLVGGNGEADVGEVIQLPTNCLEHRRVPVSNVDDPDPSREIDEPVAIDIRDYSSLRMGDGDGRNRGNPLWHRPGPAGQQRSALGARDFRLKLNHAGHPGPRGSVID